MSSESKQPNRDAFGLLIPSALPPTDAQEVALLRLLGRVQMLSVPQIQIACFPSLNLMTVRRRLERLREDGLLWRVQTRLVAVGQAPRKPQIRRQQAAYAYGLTTEGKGLLATLQVEDNAEHWERLSARDARGKAPDARTLAHDLQVAWWCLNVILEASRHRWCRSIYVQVEFISHQRQRIDALVTLRLSPTRPRPDAEMGVAPWMDGSPRRADEFDIHLALEVDRGTEQLRVLLEKGAAYRDLSLDGTYIKTLGGLVLPVFLVPDPRRASQIATEYRTIWPHGWGVISTALGASHTEDGVLWGDYRTLTTSEPFALLTRLVVGTNGVVTMQPVCDIATWRQERTTLAQGATTWHQEAGRKGMAVRWANYRAAIAKGKKVVINRKQRKRTGGRL